MSTEFWTILGVGVAVIGLNWRMYEGLYAGTSATFAVRLLVCERMVRVEGMLEAMRDFLIGKQIAPSYSGLQSFVRLPTAPAITLPP